MLVPSKPVPVLVKQIHRLLPHAIPKDEARIASKSEVDLIILQSASEPTLMAVRPGRTSAYPSKYSTSCILQSRLGQVRVSPRNYTAAVERDVAAHGDADFVSGIVVPENGSGSRAEGGMCGWVVGMARSWP
jgi:hypothetical protein